MTDELLEVRLAAHADVLVDRHRQQVTRRRSWASSRTASAILQVPGIRKELEPNMETFHSIAELRQALAPRREGRRVGLVPTMGALHEGHAALLGTARSDCDLVVASLFVNPTQFSDAADLAAYPRDLDRDAAFAAGHGVDLLFAPEAEELYPDGFATWVEPAGAAEGLEGVYRPGHFRAVATICLKLFNIVQPDVA